MIPRAFEGERVGNQQCKSTLINSVGIQHFDVKQSVLTIIYIYCYCNSIWLWAVSCLQQHE